MGGKVVIDVCSIVLILAILLLYTVGNYVFKPF